MKSWLHLKTDLYEQHNCWSLLSSKNRCWKKGSSYLGQHCMSLWEVAGFEWKLSQLNCSICFWFWVLIIIILFLQYRAPYMPPTQQYPVTSGTAGFYPGTSPAEYPAYGKGCCPKLPTTKHNHKYWGLSVKTENWNLRHQNLKLNLVEASSFGPYPFALLFARKISPGVLWFCLAHWCV